MVCLKYYFRRYKKPGVNHSMERTKWTDRKFTFDFPEGWMYNIIERLKGTEVRLRTIAGELSEQQLKNCMNGWSIQEHIGHLLDLEELHEGRIDDFIERKKVLRAADMSNRKTIAASHNERPVNEILSEFSIARNRFIRRFLELNDETLYFKSMHPRLQVLMRPVDVAFFTAEHDDHHLATIAALLTTQ